MAGGSKQKNKGSGWEREICKILSKHMGGSFIRTPHSGAYVGRSNASRLATLSQTQINASKSDIIPPDEYPHMNIEAKFYKEISFNAIMRGSCKQLEGWIEQVSAVADEKSQDFLIFKINKASSFICFPVEYMSNFDMVTYTHYDCQHGKWVITEFIPFVEKNKDKLKEFCLNAETK